MKHTVKSGTVNGGVIEDLLLLLDEMLENTFVQPYAGANAECLYCGATRNRDGSADHSAADCPVVKFKEICDKNSYFFVKHKPTDRF